VNIILLISDTFRWDNLFDRAAMPVNTPELDRFAQERAASLENCWVSSFPTIPHRTDLTSGRYGWPWHGWQPLARSGPNHSPNILRESGYVSQMLYDCQHLFRQGLHEGFDAQFTVRGQEGDTYFLRMNYPMEEVMPPEKTRGSRHFMDRNLPDISRWVNRHWRGEDDRLMVRTAGTTVEWLEENYRHDPFFLWVDFFDPHEPWDPPEYMVRKYDPDYDGTPMIHPNYGKASDLSAAELRNLRAHYCAEAELVDRWVGRVLQKIDDLDLWKNSIVIFTTDHGMSLGEHNRTGKSNINPGDDRPWPIYPEIAHIPLMVAAPGVAPGTKIHDFVQPPDILPTALELAGVQAEPPKSFHGKSFAPMLRGQAQPPLRDFVISAQYLRGDPREAGATRTTPVVYTREWAYAPIGQERTPELFDLKSDPCAERNVIADNPGVAEEMHEKLLGWLAEMNAPEEAVAAFRK